MIEKVLKAPWNLVVGVVHIFDLHRLITNHLAHHEERLEPVVYETRGMVKALLKDRGIEYEE